MLKPYPGDDFSFNQVLFGLGMQQEMSIGLGKSDEF